MNDNTKPQLVTVQPAPPEGILPWRVVAANGRVVSETADRATAEKMVGFYNDVGRKLIEAIASHKGFLIGPFDVAVDLMTILKPPLDGEVN